MDLGYLAAVVVLGGIILFHEFGHYLLARLNGIAVVEFSVGFGPRLLSWVSKKTGIRPSAAPVRCLENSGKMRMKRKKSRI